MRASTNTANSLFMPGLMIVAILALLPEAWERGKGGLILVTALILGTLFFLPDVMLSESQSKSYSGYNSDDDGFRATLTTGW